MKGNMGNPLHLKSVNHISIVCRSVEESLDFYTNILGFFPVRRPGSFNFDGAWLFSYGIGIHLLQAEEPHNMPEKLEINPKDNHISFQYVRQRVEEGGIMVDQLFFHDPDGNMIEICNCDNLPVIPLAGDTIRSCSRVNLQMLPTQQLDASRSTSTLIS